MTRRATQIAGLVTAVRGYAVTAIFSNYARARAVLFVVQRSKYGFAKAGEERLPIETTLLPSRAERMTKVLIIVHETLRTGA